MRIERESWSRNSSQGDVRWASDDDAVNPALSFGAVIMAISIFGTAIWGLTQILYKQDAINWHFEPWQGYIFSTAYIILRAMNRVMFSKP